MGTIAFEARFTGPGGTGARDGIFTYSNGQVQPVVLNTQAVPGVQDRTFSQFLGLAINGTGQIVFVASVKGQDATETSGVFLAAGGVITTLVLEKDRAPYADGRSFGKFGQPAINEAGKVAFVDSVEIRAPRTSQIPNGVFIAASTASSLIANVGSSASGGGASVLGNFQRPLIVRTSAGTDAVLFVGWNQVRGRNALWLYGQNGLASILEEGNAAVGGGTHSFIGAPALSTSGYLAFVSNLRGSPAKAGIFVNKLVF